jgi:hypothetical protein
MKHQLTAGVLVRGRDDGPASWAMGSLFELRMIGPPIPAGS